MKLYNHQLLAILDMYEVCRIEGQVTDDIANLVSQVSVYLSKEGFSVCEKCFDVIKVASLDNVHVESNGTVSELCEHCIKDVY